MVCFVSGMLTAARSPLPLESDVISERELDKLKQEIECLGKPSSAFAFYMERQRKEVKHGVTIACTTKQSFTDKWHYTIIDTPGAQGSQQEHNHWGVAGRHAADGTSTTAIAKDNHKVGGIQGWIRQYFEVGQSLGSEADPRRREQDGLRHCRLQAGKVQ